MNLVTGMHPDTITRGQAELAGGLEGRPTGGARLPGVGRPAAEILTTVGKRL